MRNHLSRQYSQWQLIACISMLLLFWSVGIRNLGQLPTLHNDEVSLLAAGWQLFAHGSYGLSMYAGFFEQEHLYLEVMPLMPLVQGLGSWLWGVGVLQMRVLPMMLGLVTLALTFRLGTKVGNRSVGLLAMLLLVCWQWAYPTPPFLISGVPLVDLARIGRYDILIAPLTLAIPLAMLDRRHKLCGVFIGLALLTHLYVIFWLPAITIIWLVRPQRRLNQLLQIYAATTITVMPWGIISLLNLPILRGQWGKHSGRFSVSQAAFYIQNITTELDRYHFGPSTLTKYTRVGYWVVVIGVPLAIIWMLYQRQVRAAILIVPSIVFSLGFALLIDKKNIGYLMAFLPLTVIIVAFSWQLWWRRWRTTRPLALLLLLAIIAQGSLSIAKALRTPSQEPTTFFAQLDNLVPDNSVVLAAQTYWPAFSSVEFRSISLPFVQTRAVTGAIMFDEALEKIQPDYVILNQTIDASFVALAQHDPSTAHYRQLFDDYLRMHDAQPVGTLVDYEQQTVTILKLNH